MKLFNNLIVLLAFAAASLLIGGCETLPHCGTSAAANQGAAKPPQDATSHHVVKVNGAGFLLDLRPGMHEHPIRDPQAVRDYLTTNIFDNFARSGKAKMLLFVHGGLNGEKQGLQHYLDFVNEPGHASRESFYPVFVVWPSGWLDTYLEHLFNVRQGLKAETGAEKAFSWSTSPLMFLADMGRAVTRLPLVLANNSKSDLETVFPIRHGAGRTAYKQYQLLVHDDYNIYIGDDYSRERDRSLRTVTYWGSIPIKYFIASMIDGMGKGAWDDMLRRTQEMYPARFNLETAVWNERVRESETNAPASPDAAPPAPATTRDKILAQRYKSAGLPIFITMLSSNQQTNPKLKVTLVGHSMGTIILNRVVRDAQIEFDKIIYMGAACSIADFATSVLPYMKEHRSTDFYNLSLHPVAEAGEWYPQALDLPPRGSLLVWIDNFLANPVTEQERTMGRWRNLFRSSDTGEPLIRQFFANSHEADFKGRLHFRAYSVGFGDKNELRAEKFQWNNVQGNQQVCNASARCDNPLSHGEFSEMPYWQPAFWWNPEIDVARATGRMAAKP